jgi:hypothetical protein
MFRALALSLLIPVFIYSCGEKTLFEKISSSRSGIAFANTIGENDSVNVLDFENVYNGGGVGVGDFNNDGLQDLYFTGNMVSHKLYLNKGSFSFSDITEQAGVGGAGHWGRGVAVVDINNDGWDDLYVCSSVKKQGRERENLLYINKGLNKQGIPQFENKAAEYGLNDSSHSTMAAFFDYDNDADLDVYILVNEIIKGDFPNRFRPRLLKGEHPSTGRLYRNDWNDSLQHPYYTNVSSEAGITIEGYGHGVSVTDINLDGWKDLYISNDYLSNNILYVNNGDGTFTDHINDYFKHTSANAMGNDVIDINNDGLQDVIELDMNPEDNYRKKMMMNANSYQTFTNSDFFNYQYQYVRNTLQLNQGPRVLAQDSVGAPVFSDISFYAGVAETDWSWTPLVNDFDNDGFRDLIITNGFPRDVTDHDFVAFRNEAFAIATKKQLLEQIPAVKVHNYAFKNNGDLTFSNESVSWGFEDQTFSNGAAYADLDNDGDLDVVINNINDEASVYRNRLMDDRDDDQRYLSLKLVGDQWNRNALGTWVELYYQGQKQVYEQSPYRGYLSSIQKNPHFGLGKVKTIDSIVVKWPGGTMQKLTNVVTNKTVTLQHNDAVQKYTWEKPDLASQTVFTDVTGSLQINFMHEERDFVDFNIQKLLPHKFSEYGPALAAGDVDGDGLDDFIAGGSFSVSPTLFLQQQNGSFVQKPVFPQASNHTKRWEDLGLLLFDADGDKDLDLYSASGGYENQPGTDAYADQFYLNDGRGNFSLQRDILPKNFTSKSCVRAADYDKDGDLDLFVAGRVEPWNYPKPVSSFIYRNDSKNGRVVFTDMSGTAAKALKNIGLVCDAVWTDFDNDGWMDLLLAGEWMPLTFLKNNKGILENSTATMGVAGKTG